jgi:hypothetical protein
MRRKHGSQRTMTDSELESKLKGVPVPERTAEYWEDFPTQIRWQLRQHQSRPAARRSWRPLLVWSADFALLAVLVFVCLQCHPLQTVSTAIGRQEIRCHREFARLDSGLHKLILNTDGMSYLLAEAN